MLKPGFQILNAKNAEEAEIYLYGTIGRFWAVDTQKIIQRIEQLKAEGLKRITFYVNSNGGEVSQGILLYNYLFRNSFEITYVVDGIAASMAALLLLVPGANVKMAKYAKLMIHSVSGYASGTISQIRKQADEMESWQKDLIDIVATRTGLSNEKVTSKWFDEKDHWIGSGEALSLKLIDEVIDGKKSVQPANNVDDAFGVMQHYEIQLKNQLQNQNEDTMKLTNEFAQVLSLTGEQSEDSILAAVRKMSGELTTAQQSLKDKDKEIESLNEKVEDHDKEKVKNLIDGAIEAKKIGADLRDTYTGLAEKDYDSTKKILDGMKGVPNVKGSLDQGGGANQSDKKHEGWTLVDFMKKDGKALENIKENAPERYKQLYRDQYGKDPVE